MAELKLIALDADDLAVISAQLQDAVLRVGDIAYLPREAAAGGRRQPLRLGRCIQARRRRTGLQSTSIEWHNRTCVQSF